MPPRRGHALLTRSRRLAQQIPLLAQPARPLAASHAAGAQSIYFEEDGALAGAVSQTVVVAPRPSRRGAVRSAVAALLAAYRRYEAYLLTLGVVFFYLAFTIIQVCATAVAAHSLVCLSPSVRRTHAGKRVQAAWVPLWRVFHGTPVVHLFRHLATPLRAWQTASGACRE